MKKKFRDLQDQASEAMERAERLQKEVEKEKRAREEVCILKFTCTGGKGEHVCVGRNVRHVVDISFCKVCSSALQISFFGGGGASPRGIRGIYTTESQ